MAVEVILPMLGETMDEATIVRWLVDVGHPVKKGEPIYQVETDKAVLDVGAPADGVLSRILYGAGSRVPVLAVVGMITPTSEGSAAAQAGAVLLREKLENAGASANVSTGTQHAADESEMASMPTDRVLASPRARALAEARGVDLRHVKGTGPGGRIVEADVQAYLASGGAALPEGQARVLTTPLARKLADEKGVELQTVAGSGPGGRITKADITAAVASATRPLVPPLEVREPAAQSIAMTGIRRIIADRMSRSSQTTASVTLTTDVDATECVRLRTLLKEKLSPELGFAISYTDILVAITARALRNYPYMNARLEGDEIRLLPAINIGVAVDTERGLLVPVIRDADRKGIGELARALRTLVERARAGKSLPDDLTGGSFTITNLGMYDIDAFTPIINLPECAILGVGRLRDAAAIHNGQVCARKLMALSLTFDHRLVDGAPAGRFLQCIRRFVEEPYLLLT